MTDLIIFPKKSPPFPPYYGYKFLYIRHESFDLNKFQQQFTIRVAVHFNKCSHHTYSSGNHSMARLRLRIEKRVRCYKVFRFRLFSERQFSLMNNAIPTFLSLHSFLVAVHFPSVPATPTVYDIDCPNNFDRGKTVVHIHRES